MEPTVLALLGKALEKYIQTGLQGYAQVALAHVLHEKILHLCHDLHKALQSGSTPQELAAQTAYSKATLRKLFTAWDDRDARQGLEKVVGRIDKHFSEVAELKQIVWSYCRTFVETQLRLFNKDLALMFAGDLVLPINIDGLFPTD